VEACFSQLTLDVIGKAVFNYDFNALTTDSPLIQVGTRFPDDPTHISWLRTVMTTLTRSTGLRSLCEAGYSSVLVLIDALPPPADWLQPQPTTATCSDSASSHSC